MGDSPLSLHATVLSVLSRNAVSTSAGNPGLPSTFFSWAQGPRAANESRHRQGCPSGSHHDGSVHGQKGSALRRRWSRIPRKNLRDDHGDPPLHQVQIITSNTSRQTTGVLCCLLEWYLVSTHQLLSAAKEYRLEVAQSPFDLTELKFRQT